MSLNKKIISDDSNPEWTKDMFAKSIDVRGLNLVEAAQKLRKFRGKQLSPKKIPVSIRLSQNIIDHFKADGAGWQSRIDRALNEIITKK